MPEIISHDVEVSMSKQDFEDVVDIAGYGINYWVKKAVVDTDNLTYTIQYENPDDEGYLTATLTNNDLEKAWARIITEPICAQYIREYFLDGDVGDIDATAGDVLIQIALFGKIVYG